MDSSQNPNLGEAASLFLANLPAEEKGTSQQEIYKFVRWYGWERPLAGLTAPEIASYAEHLSLSDIDYIKNTLRFCKIFAFFIDIYFSI